MTLAEQARRRVKLARAIGREPVRWLATEAVAEQLMAEAPADWQLDDSAFLGVPIERADTRWGLVLVSDPAANPYARP